MPDENRVRRRRTVATPGNSRMPGSVAASIVAPTGSPSSVRFTTYAGRYLQRPVQPRVAEQHRTDREAEEDPELARRLAEHRRADASPRRSAARRSSCRRRAPRTARDRASPAGAVRRRRSTPPSPRQRARARRRAARGPSWRSTRTRDRDTRRRTRRPSRRAMPTHCARVGGSRSHPADSSATIAGCMFTSTTDAATVVSSTEAFQLQKCSASITPAPSGEQHAGAIEPSPLTPRAGDDERDGDDDQREAEAPDRDRERMRVRQPHERTRRTRFRAAPDTRTNDAGMARECTRARHVDARSTCCTLLYIGSQRRSFLSDTGAGPCECRRGSH